MGEWSDGAMRDVCGSSRWERDRALMLERRWMVKVRDFETYGGAALLLMSQCQQGSNRASIIDNVLPTPSLPTCVVSYATISRSGAPIRREGMMLFGGRSVASRRKA
jgi:hypothetical protein